MMYIMSQKFFKKNVEKLVAPNQYFLIDGENFGTTGNRSDAVASKYANSYSLGGFCPERELYNILKKIKKDEDFSKKKFERELKEFLHSKDFIGAACASMKAQASYGVDSDMNIFIVIPNVVYKIIGEIMCKSIVKMAKVEDFKFIFTEDDIEKKGKKILKNTLKKKELKEILKSVKRLEKKHDLDYSGRDDDDD